MMRGRSREDERGAALLEFALLLPIIVILLALMFDVGAGFIAGQSSAEAARSAARIASQDPTSRDADYLALSSIRSSFIDAGDTVQWVAIYLTTPASGDTIPAACRPGGGGATGVCNVYSGAQIAALAPEQFEGTDCSGDLDALWCPLDREEDDGEYLGVAVWGANRRTIGLLINDPVELHDQAVFPIFVGGASDE